MKQFPIIDCHIHYAKVFGKDRLERILKENGISGCAFQCIPMRHKIPVEMDALEWKKEYPDKTYVFGGIERSIYTSVENSLSEELCSQVDHLMKMGCDGIKMLEGKPDVRRNVPIPDFDTEVWEAYWSKLEKEQIPLLMHVNDPEEFWDEEKIPESAKEKGWFYGKETIHNEDQYRQILEVLNRHPNLNIVFAHFFFFSAQLPRLSDILDCYPNVKIDITPGIELYYNLSEDTEKSKRFFQKYSDRICYGTDIGSGEILAKHDVLLNMENCVDKIHYIRRFLETADVFTAGLEKKLIRGLALEDHILEKIYAYNFLGFVNRKNKK